MWDWELPIRLSQWHRAPDHKGCYEICHGPPDYRPIYRGAASLYPLRDALRSVYMQSFTGQTLNHDKSTLWFRTGQLSAAELANFDEFLENQRIR